MRCDAKTRNGNQCKSFALRDKDRCRMHAGRPIVHGMRSKYKGVMLGDRVQELIDDPEITNMRIQLATLIALAQDLLARVEDTKFWGLGGAGALASLTVEITKAIERYHKVTEGSRYTIRIEHIQVVINQIVKVADDTITDPADRKRFISRLDKLTLPATASSN